MKDRKMRIISLSVLLALGFVAGGAWQKDLVTANANSAQTYWKGVSATGAMITDETCPIVVENELLTFDLQEYPKEYYYEKEDYLAYTGKVTAEYAFYNPADYAVQTRLAFPFGKIPYYGVEDCDSFGNYIAVDTQKYAVSVNGEKIQSTIRHTLSDSYSNFSVETDLPKLLDGFVEHEFYRLDTPVYHVVYEPKTLGAVTNYGAETAAFVWKDLPDIKLVLGDGLRGSQVVGNGHQFKFTASIGEPIHLYFVGGMPTQLPEWRIYENAACEEDIGGEVVRKMQKEAEPTTFQQFVMQAYDEDFGVLEHDWYNAVVANLDNNQHFSNCENVTSCTSKDLNIVDRLLRWHEYELSFAPKERITNTVTAPMYPDIDTGYSTPVYTYTYLLSPAKTWKQFGNLDIVVNTPYYIIDSEGFAFVKGEKGYTLSLDGLPDGELTFALCSDENQTIDRGGFGCFATASGLASGTVLLAFGLAMIKRKEE